MLARVGVHPSWIEVIDEALSMMDAKYLGWLENDNSWLPGADKLFAAFSQPLEQTRYILFGESPYPREQSANGYAFWDAAVSDLWSLRGLSTSVNRATSLRNLLKMLLLAEGALCEDDLSQNAIANLDKSTYIDSGRELFTALIQHGFLLLNASLVLSQQPVSIEAKAWHPFMAELLRILQDKKPDIKLILFGKVAERILMLEEAKPFQYLQAEHPYNISFITNPIILDFFKPFQLLNKQVVSV